MDKKSFCLLALEDQLIVLKTEGEQLMQAPCLENFVTLYSYKGYLVEEYRDLESDELIKIAPITEENEEEQLSKYNAFIEFANHALNFDNRDKSNSMLACVGCDYEWFPSDDTKLKDISCPICNGKKLTFLMQNQCQNCNFIYYSGDGIYKQVCPKCK